MSNIDNDKRAQVKQLQGDIMQGSSAQPAEVGAQGSTTAGNTKVAATQPAQSPVSLPPQPAPASLHNENEEALRNRAGAAWDEALAALKERKARYRDETDGERDARIQRERRNADWAAVADALRSMSNLYFATQGAPATKPVKTLSERDMELRERARKQLDDNRDEYLNAVLRQAKIAQDNYDNAVASRRKQANDEMSREYNNARVNYYNQLGKGKVAADAFRAEQIDNQRDYNRARLEEQVRHNKASERIAQERVNKKGATSSGKGSKYSLRIPDGRIFTYPNAAMYNKAVNFYYPGDNKRVTTDSMTGKQTTTVTDDVAKRAAEGERNTMQRHTAERQKPQKQTSSKNRYTHTKALGL